MRRLTLTSLTCIVLLLAAACTEPPSPPVARDGSARPTKVPKADGQAYTPRFIAVGCPFERDDEHDVDCGYLVVPENRAKPAGREVKLAVAIVRSTAERPRPDPLLYLEGGPGGSAVYDPAFWYDTRFLKKRDVILLDQRGTGYSLPSLNCPEMERDDVVSFDDQVDAARACRKRLAGEGVDLKQYNSAATAADIADLRLALGLEQINLFGVSYGTRAALTAMRDHPEGIRSVVLDSSYPPHVDAYTEGAANAAAAIEVLFQGCAADRACARAYPKLDRTFYRLVAKLNRAPATLERTDPDTGETYEEELYGDDLVSYLVDWLYDTSALPYLPRAIDEAADGEFELVVELLDGPSDEGDEAETLAAPQTVAALAAMDTSAEEQGDVTDSEGAFYSVECREELIFGDLEEARRAVRAYNKALREPLMGSLDQTAAVCDVWGAGRARVIEDRPVASDIPALVLAGEYDPVTPPRWGEETAAHLSRGLFFSLPGMGHGVVFSDDCAARIAASFVDNPTRAPGTACLKKLTGPDFDVE
jgi:pimeloyl-ACP methyl ester carboxylesterase